MKKSINERFSEKFMPEPNSGCWLWLAAIDREFAGQSNPMRKLIALDIGYAPWNLAPCSVVQLAGGLYLGGSGRRLLSMSARDIGWILLGLAAITWIFYVCWFS